MSDGAAKVRKDSEPYYNGNASEALEAFMKSISEIGDDISSSNELEGRFLEATAASAEKSAAGANETSHVVPAAISHGTYSQGLTNNDNRTKDIGARRENKAPPDSVFKRDIYKVDPSVDALTIEETVLLKKNLNIETTGMRVPKPIQSFEQLKLSIPMAISKRIKKLGFIEPTSVQCQAIPVLLQGRNTIIMGSKGCGKTVSYLIPLVCQILNIIKECKSVASKRCAYSIIMGLTRESCYNIHRTLYMLLKRLNLRIASITSGYDNYNEVISGTEFLIVTPAKFGDLLRQKCIDPTATHLVALDDFVNLYKNHPDEIGLLLTYEHAMRIIVSRETLASETLKTLRKYLKQSITVKYTANQSLLSFEFKCIACMNEETRLQKTTILGDLISHFHKDFRMIIFANDRLTVENVYTFLSNLSKSVMCVHEKMSLDDIYAAMEDLKSLKIQIVVSTDIALSNMRLPKVNYIVNFDMPRAYPAFISRIRCQTSDVKTVVYNLISRQDHIICAHICYHLEQEGLNIPPTLENTALSWKDYRGYRKGGKPMTNLSKDNKEVNLNINIAENKLKQKYDAPVDGAPGTEGSQKYSSSPAIIKETQTPVTHEDNKYGIGDAGEQEYHEYGVDDDISSDDELDIVPKRQITKSEGLINLDKINKRRLRLAEDAI
ncbi:ATP-dependent RNA helicase DBP3 like protein [Babesia gibsoni]|uniref:RNA helicase n=1 Tax=Babesia gibsoni TaxID=33632 RepID=A0AAD8LK16_BABGI|nr:ATP-dependent RNA helicase DBP3 like protein [Babesia gibsoni]